MQFFIIPSWRNGVNNTANNNSEMRRSDFPELAISYPHPYTRGLRCNPLTTAEIICGDYSGSTRYIFSLRVGRIEHLKDQFQTRILAELDAP
jgi:hypothetical protein